MNDSPTDGARYLESCRPGAGRQSLRSHRSGIELAARPGSAASTWNGVSSARSPAPPPWTSVLWKTQDLLPKALPMGGDLGRKRDRVSLDHLDLHLQNRTHSAIQNPGRHLRWERAHVQGWGVSELSPSPSLTPSSKGGRGGCSVPYPSCIPEQPGVYSTIWRCSHLPHRAQVWM